MIVALVELLPLRRGSGLLVEGAGFGEGILNVGQGSARQQQYNRKTGFHGGTVCADPVTAASKSCKKVDAIRQRAGN